MRGANKRREKKRFQDTVKADLGVLEVIPKKTGEEADLTISLKF